MYELARSPTQELGQVRKSVLLSYALWIPCFFGLSGLHRFYQGRYLSALLWFFTGGFLGIGNVIDAFMMPRMVDDVNRGAKVW